MYLSRALLLIREDRRELIVLGRYRGMKYEQIADLLDVDVGTVKVRMHRAIKELRETFLRLTHGSGTQPCDAKTPPRRLQIIKTGPCPRRRRVRWNGTPRSARGAASVAPLRQGWRWGPVAALSGAAAALVVGVAIGRTTTPPPPPDPAVTELRQELRDMRVMVGLALMQQPSASERLRGVSWSSRIDQPGNDVVEALLDTLMHDSNDNVRLATVDALRRFADREIVRTAAVEALSRQTSPLVQAALIDFVVDADDRAAVDTLHRLSNDETVHDSVRERAARAAKQLS